jgi:predicted phosphodiesterase
MKTLSILLIATLLATAVSTANARDRRVSGRVFVDANFDGRRDKDEKGVPGVLVSNSIEVARTDKNGRYSLPLVDDAPVFVIKPAGYRLPLSADHIPAAYSLNKPNGSPDYIKDGIAAEPVPAELDFPLYPAENEDTLKIGLLGDTQTRHKDEIYYVGQLVAEQLIDEQFDFVVPLGDLVYDDLSKMLPLRQTLGRIGATLYPVMGNHDQNYEARNIRFRDETYKKHFGPSYYAFHYGRNAFLVLNNIFPDTTDGSRRYIGKIDDRQTRFIQSYLAALDSSTPIYLFMHIPLDEIKESRAFLALFKDHPNVMAFAGHTHTQYSHSIARADGWPHDTPLREIVTGAVCGSWWHGDKDFFGVPASPMQDGTPRGYWVMHLAGNAAPTFEYKLSGNVYNKQMHVWTPYAFAREKFWQDTREVIANVYAADEETIVEARLDDDATWIPMERFAGHDPYYVRITSLRAMNIPTGENTIPFGAKVEEVSRHLWRLPIPADLKPGVHVVRVRASNSRGLEARSAALLHVE